MSRWQITGIILAIMACTVPLVLLAVQSDGSVEFSNSIIHISAKSGEFGKIETALQSGADINSQDEYGKTPLHYAAENGHSQTTQSLLAIGADRMIEDKAGNIALTLAKNNSHGKTAGVLE